MRRKELAPIAVAASLLACAPQTAGDPEREASGPVGADADRRVEPIDEAVPELAAHFLVGNESRHDLFAGLIAGRGGAYLGVGGEQNYTMIAASGAEVAFILDHDRRIIDLHRELGRRIVDAEGPAELLAGLDDPAEAPPPALAESWPAITRHLRRVATRSARGSPSAWLGDPVLFDIIRDRWRRGAVVLVVGDLAGDVAMRSIAAAAASRAASFSVIYLSNVEERIAAPRRLGENLDALPRRADAQVLRTFYREPYPAADGLWSYQSQGLADLVWHLRSAPDPSLAAILAEAEDRGELLRDPAEPGLSRIAGRADPAH